jgi:hypothetical protein
MPSVPMRLVAAHLAAWVTGELAVPVISRMVEVQAGLMVVQGSPEVM